ncbi:hypothetical protein RCXUPER_111 [Rhodobacter phage RcXuper]|nr:hypothetical protein RCXUPER_111 [Rhodobacter phage RcXuper]
MGTSTDAILAYGFDLGEDLSEHGDLARIDEEFDGDEDAFFEAELGIPAYGEPGRPSYDEIEKLKATLPVTLIRHCSGDYPMYFLALPGTKREASRGAPEAIEINSLRVSTDAVTALMKWCEDHGIEVPEEGPHWHIFSYWC